MTTYSSALSKAAGFEVQSINKMALSKKLGKRSTVDPPFRSPTPWVQSWPNFWDQFCSLCYKNCREKVVTNTTPVPPGRHILTTSQSIKQGHIKKAYKPISSHFIKCSTYVHFKDEPLTSLCRLPPWLAGGNIAESLRVDKNGVAVGKVDLVFVLFFLYGTVHFGLSP